MTKKPKRKPLIIEWLAHASENLLCAKDAAKAEYSPFHTISFLCQNAGEKFLKAYLLWNGWSLEKTHDLSKLVTQATAYDETFGNLLQCAEVLNKYITEGRYPGDLPFETISEADAKEAIECAGKIEAFVLARIDLERLSES